MAPVPRVEHSSCRLSDTCLTRFAGFPVTELVLARVSGNSYSLVSSSAFAFVEDAPTEF